MGTVTKESMVITSLGAPGGDKSVKGFIIPKELTFTKPIQWTSSPGAGTENRQDAGDSKQVFQGVKPYDLSAIDLLFDGYEEGGKVTGQQQTVVECVETLKSFTLPLDHGKGKKHPPLIALKWGPTEFRGVITSFSYTYTMFRQDGTPVRAKVNLALQEATPQTMWSAPENRAGN